MSMVGCAKRVTIPNIICVLNKFDIATSRAVSYCLTAVSDG